MQQNETRIVNMTYQPAPTRRERDELDIRDQIQKLGVTFDGGKGFLDFVERTDEISVSYGIDKRQQVWCVLILLRDKALQW